MTVAEDGRGHGGGPRLDERHHAGRRRGRPAAGAARPGRAAADRRVDPPAGHLAAGTRRRPATTPDGEGHLRVRRPSPEPDDDHIRQAGRIPSWAREREAAERGATAPGGAPARPGDDTPAHGRADAYGHEARGGHGGVAAPGHHAASGGGAGSDGGTGSGGAQQARGTTAHGSGTGHGVGHPGGAPGGRSTPGTPGRTRTRPHPGPAAHPAAATRPGAAPARSHPTDRAPPAPPAGPRASPHPDPAAHPTAATRPGAAPDRRHPGTERPRRRGRWTERERPGRCRYAAQARDRGLGPAARRRAGRGRWRRGGRRTADGRRHAARRRRPGPIPPPCCSPRSARGPGCGSGSPGHPEALVVRLGTADRAETTRRAGHGGAARGRLARARRTATAAGRARPVRRRAARRAALARGPGDRADQHGPGQTAGGAQARLGLARLAAASAARARPGLPAAPRLRPGPGGRPYRRADPAAGRRSARAGLAERRPPARSQQAAGPVRGARARSSSSTAIPAPPRCARPRRGSPGPELAAGIHVLCLAETPAASPLSPVAATYEAACAASLAFRECGAVALLSGDVATALRLLRTAAGQPAGHGTVAAVDAVSARLGRAVRAGARTAARGRARARVVRPGR